MKRPSKLFVLCSVAALALTGCAASSPADQNSGEEKIVRVALPSQPATLDPHSSTILAEVTRPIYETLLTVDENWEIQPMLAESYERSDDGLTFTFHLRPDLVFHDGSELDATDVVASMERWMRVTPFGKANFPDATWTAIDPLTVELKVTEASFLHELQLSSRLVTYPAIVPSEVIDKFGDDPLEDVIGSGPFTFEEWIPDQTLTLKKWDDYQAVDGPRSGTAGDRTPFIDGVEFSFVTDSSSRVLGFTSGQYDMTTKVPSDDVEQVKNTDGLAVGTYMVSPTNMIFSSGEGPIRDFALREAIHVAIDREAIGFGATGSDELFDLTHHQMTSAQEKQWNTEVGKENWNLADPAKAQELLAQSSYAGEPLTLIVTRDYIESYQAAVIIQSQLKDAGINVEIDTLEWGTFSSRYDEDPESWDMAILPMLAAQDPSQTPGLSAGRPGYWPTPELEQMLSNYRKAMTIEDANKQYDDLQAYIESVRPLTRIYDIHGTYGATEALGEVPVFNGAIVWWNVDYVS